jgi:hypothetical protein
MSKLEKILSTTSLVAAICLLLWAGIIYNASGEAVGTISQIYVENGVTKIEFISDSGDKEIYEYTGKGVPQKGPARLKFFKTFFLPPKAIDVK